MAAGLAEKAVRGRSRGRSLRSVNEDYGLMLHEVEEFAEKLPDEFLRCRELGHNWVPHTVNKYRNAYVRKLRCTRCRTKKKQELDSRGMLVGNPSYEHPEGYLHKGQGQIKGDGRGVLRLASLHRGRITEVDEDL